MLTLKGVTKKYGSVRAVSGVSLELPHRGLVAIVGLNGSGKSTLLELIAGVRRPTDGSLQLDGHDITNVSLLRRSRAGIGIGFQRPTAVEALTFEEQLELAAESADPRALWNRMRKPQSRIPNSVSHGTETLAELLGLDGILHKPASDGSWGQVRLLSIACAAIVGRRLLLLDEPFAGLDQENSLRVNVAIHKLKQDRLVIAADHRVRLLAEHADVTLALQRGRAVLFESTGGITTLKKAMAEIVHAE